MNYIDTNSNIVYSSSVLGNNIPVACGVSKSNKKIVSQYVFGDAQLKRAPSMKV